MEEVVAFVCAVGVNEGIVSLMIHVGRALQQGFSALGDDCENIF